MDLESLPALYGGSMALIGVMALYMLMTPPTPVVEPARSAPVHAPAAQTAFAETEPRRKKKNRHDRRSEGAGH